MSVPDVLRQKCEQTEETVREFSSIVPSSSSTWIGYEDGRFLFWKGKETKYLWVKDGAGKLKIYRYHNGPQHAQIHLEYDFGKTAIINDAIYFPISATCHGIVVAIHDRAMSKHSNYLAYFSLRSRRLLTCVYVPFPVTKVYGVIDGTAKNDAFEALAEPFHTGWPHILLIGCRFGYSYLLTLGITNDNLNTDDETNSQNGTTHAPIKAKKTIPLSKMFVEDDMFVFRSDEDVTKCIEKDKVSVTALTYVEKSKLVVIGFNFGGILCVSLKTSKVMSHLYLEGEVNHFAMQEPEEDPRPILFLWVSIQSPQKGGVVLLLSMNYPKDEAATKEPSEYTYDEPVFMPCLKWVPDNCKHMVSMRTLVFNKQKNPDDSKDFGKCSALSDSRTSQYSDHHSSTDMSLMLMTWIEKNSVLNGSLFDLNAFYAKRLMGRVTTDNTIAQQMPFLSRFSSKEPFGSSARRILDVAVEYVRRFAAPAFLKDSIDQLYYPSTFHMTMNCITGKKMMQLKVLPIQVQLIANISNNIVSYFNQPTEPCKWVCAIGLANSAPSSNMNEERACLLRVLMHNYFPGVLKMIEHCAANPETLKFMQKWIWKEVELTKSKFDDLCSPLFAFNSAELSPSAQGFIHHARVFFKRASLVLESISSKVETFENNQDWLASVNVQLHATRQVKMYSYGVAFGLTYGLLPTNVTNALLFDKTASEFTLRFDKIRKQRKAVKIHQVISEAMVLEKENMAWQEQTAQNWYPPSDFTNVLPVLLLMKVPELSKLTILGYYCLDIETVANVSSMQENIFAKACCFFMQEDYSMDVMNEIRMIWLNDKQAAEVDQDMIQLIVGSRKKDPGQKESELRWLPLCTPEEIEHAKSEYLKLDHGVHRFNWNVIKKQRYNLIIEAPLPTGPEPSFVVECRAKSNEIREKYPWLFKKVDSLPEFVLNKYKEKLAKDAEAQKVFVGLGPKYQDQARIPLSVRHTDDVTKRRRPAEDLGMIDVTGDEAMEELPLSIATPAKRQRLMLFPVTPVNLKKDSSTKAATTVKSDSNRQSFRSTFSEYKDKSAVINKDSVKAKDWDRVNRVIQTPISLTKKMQSRIPIRCTNAQVSRSLFALQRPADVDICNSSPPPDTSVKPVQTPASILKQSEHKSRLPNSAKPKLRFAMESQIEDIPSRADKLLDDLNDTSFSNFAVLSNESSTSTPPCQGVNRHDDTFPRDGTPLTSRTETSHLHVPAMSTSYEEQDEDKTETSLHHVPAMSTSYEEQDEDDAILAKGAAQEPAGEEFSAQLAEAMTVPSMAGVQLLTTVTSKVIITAEIQPSEEPKEVETEQSKKNEEKAPEIVKATLTRAKSNESRASTSKSKKDEEKAPEIEKAKLRRSKSNETRASASNSKKDDEKAPEIEKAKLRRSKSNETRASVSKSPRSKRASESETGQRIKARTKTASENEVSDETKDITASDTAREWVEAHLRRSTRMRSPRKLFDGSKDTKRKH
ncbi:beta-propeller of ELYS nucleoporin domain-containing protein [Ditylenchus destructor]|nr:beta-propeller of ELYS nucleoporin domain-containing protein [Ditylenchus destructor]